VLPVCGRCANASIWACKWSMRSMVLPPVVWIMGTPASWTCSRPLEVFGEGARDPLEVPFGRPVLPPADRGEAPAGRIARSPADRREVAANRVEGADHQPSEAGEIMVPPDHHVVRAGAYVRGKGIAAQLVIAHDQVAQPVRAVWNLITRVVRTVRAVQAIDEVQVWPR
jgi:hypothetical protein